KNDSVIFVGEDNLHYEKFADGTVKCIEDEIPFEVPEGWEWTRLGNLCAAIQYGLSNSAEPEGSYKFLRITDIQNGMVNWDTVPFTRTSDPNTYLLKSGDIVFARTGATVGKSFLITETPYPSVYASYLIRIRLLGNLPSEYIYQFFDSACYWSQITDKSVGVGQPNCNGTSLKKLLIPLPPINEQLRIIPTVQKLLEYVTEIDTEEKTLMSIITAVKSKILDLAIRGKLVPQDPDDEPASILLESIRAEKEELIKQGKIKRNKKESFVFKGEDNSYYEKFGNRVKNIDNEIPFELPNSWTWCRGYSCFEGMESAKPQGEFFDYIDINAIDNRLHKIKETKRLPVSDAPSRASRSVKNGSVLFSLVRPYLENIALVKEKYSSCIASTGFYICNSNGTFLPEFMFYLMISGYVVDGLNQYMKGDNSPSISKENIEGWLYPVPPGKEQKAICAKLQSVFALIESVEKSLS
ncbi:MAG: restriction endonuclease subunit S, partial [Merdimonas faecis]|uniref:restriction endonuclease subunit S n=1 Tax=Merdimonas faecis TaxID=1653435 RepID=UPI003990485F